MTTVLRKIFLNLVVLAEDDSPYPEVRSAVANTDDPDMPVNTFRAWFIGFIWSIILPGMKISECSASFCAPRRV